MNLRRTIAALACAALGFGLGRDAFAQGDAVIRPRWRVFFSHEKPEPFIYEDGLGVPTRYFYMKYTIENKTDQVIPIAFNVILRTDQGRAFHQDPVQLDKEYKPKGKYYSDTYYPVVEPKMIEHAEKLGNMNPEMILEHIAEMKKERRYLNVSDLRKLRVIRNGEKLECIATFREPDVVTDVIEVLVFGLVDVLKVDKVENARVHYAYENHVFHVLYDYHGDEFDRHRDALKRVRDWWEIKQLGPTADKDMLEKMLVGLTSQDMVERQSSFLVLSRTLDQTFGYDAVKTPEENDLSIRRWKEYWVRNKTNLVYNWILNRFEIVETQLPGETPIEPPK